jgi:hypothetical protein
MVPGWVVIIGALWSYEYLLFRSDVFRQVPARPRRPRRRGAPYWGRRGLQSQTQTPNILGLERTRTLDQNDGAPTQRSPHRPRGEARS